jgi:hypothetical protein
MCCLVTFPTKHLVNYWKTMCFSLKKALKRRNGMHYNRVPSQSTATLVQKLTVSQNRALQH